MSGFKEDKLAVNVDLTALSSVACVYLLRHSLSSDSPSGRDWYFCER